MKLGGRLLYGAFGLIVLTLQNSAHGIDAVPLTPFVGETTRDFEARKRGSSNSTVANRKSLIVQADPSGHYFVEPRLDGQPLRMLVDTGASVVTLSYEDAESMALRMSKRDFTQRVLTANGPVEAAPVRIAKVQVGDIVISEVEALVLPPGRLKTSLLGMTFLKRLSAFEISSGKLLLRE